MITKTARFVLDPGFLKNAETFSTETAALAAREKAREAWRRESGVGRTGPVAAQPVLYSRGVRRPDGVEPGDTCRLERGRESEQWVPCSTDNLSLKVRRALGLAE